MIKNLVKHGNSHALVIDKAILELLRIDPEQPLSLHTDGQSLIIRPATATDNERSERLRKSLEKTNKSYGSVLKRLAE